MAHTIATQVLLDNTRKPLSSLLPSVTELLEN